jgi:hypothetical protein
MKANELRIGNYVTVIKTNGTIEDFEAQIQCADITRIFDKCFNIWNYRPITITEEWITKLAFQDNTHGYYLEKSKQPNFDAYLFYYSSCDDDVLLRGVRYVHELQNLYFALTGEELEINL